MLELGKRIIGIDKDDVLIDLNRSLHPFHNKHYGTNVTFEDLHTFDLKEMWGCTPDEALERVYKFYDSKEFQRLVPVEGAVEAITELRERNGLMVVTSRPSFMLERTRLSLDRYFPGLFDGIHLTNGFSRQGLKRKKSEVCLDLGITTLIDDHIDNLTDCAENGITPILFRRPWNRAFTETQLKSLGIIPANNWPQVLELLRGDSFSI